MDFYFHGTGKMNKEIVYEMRRYLHPEFFHTIMNMFKIMIFIFSAFAFFRGFYVAAVLFLVGIPVISFEHSFFSKLSAKKVIKSFKEMGFSEMVFAILITEEGLIIKNPEAENSMKIGYEHISKIIEFETFILFLTKQNQPHPLLKDKLPEEVKYDLFSMIKEKNPKIKFVNIKVAK